MILKRTHRQRWQGETWAWCIVTVSLACSGSGCGSRGDRPPLAPVTGMVTMDGKPLANKDIVFAPQGGRPSAGVTDEQGEYELRYTSQIKGAIIGHHAVTISTPRGPEGQGRETIPQRYNGKSELTAEVADTKNRINFELLSK